MFFWLLTANTLSGGTLFVYPFLKLLDLSSYSAGDIYTYKEETYLSITDKKFIKLDEELSIHKFKTTRDFIKLSATFIDHKYLDILKEIPKKFILSKGSEKRLNLSIENLFHRYYNIKENDKSLPIFVDHGFGGLYKTEKGKFIFKINSFEFILLETMEVINYQGELYGLSYESVSISQMKELILSLGEMNDTFVFESYHQSKMDDFISNYTNSLKNREDEIKSKELTVNKKIEKEKKYNKENTISLVKNFIVNDEHAINLKLVSGISYLKGFIHLNCGAQIYKFDIAKEQFKEIRDTFLSLGEENVTF